MPIFNVSSEGFAFYAEAENVHEALKVGEPLLGPNPYARVCETSLIEGILSVDNRNHYFAKCGENDWREIAADEFHDMRVISPRQGPEDLTKLLDNLPHIHGDMTTPDFDAPVTKGAVICVGYGMSRPAYVFYRKREPEAEIWSINMDRLPEATRHFQIHKDEFVSPRLREILDVSNIDQTKTKVYTFDTYPFKSIRRQFLVSSVDYMLALADAEGFSRVYMPGMDFGGTRDIQEVFSARYWIGVLEGKGAKVFLSPMSRVFECNIYCHEIEHMKGVKNDSV